MSKKIKDQEVLLVKDQKDDSLRAVVGADGKSGLKLHSFKVLTRIVFTASARAVAIFALISTLPSGEAYPLIMTFESGYFFM